MKQKGMMKKIFSLLIVLTLVVAGVVSLRKIAIASEGDADSCEKAIVEKIEISDYRQETTVLRDGDEATYYSKVPTCSEDGYIFAGWYETETCDTGDVVKPLGTDVTSGEYYAKFVPAHILTIKGQIHNDSYQVEGDETNYRDLRVVTTTDSMWYDQIGFYLTINGVTKITTVDFGEEVQATGVYRELTYVGKDATGGSYSTDESYTPEGAFCAMSYWFKTWTITGIPESAWNAEIAAVPFWITQDGTLVTGESGVKNVNEGIYKTVNDEAFEARIGERYYFDTLTTALSYTTGSASAEITLLNDIEVTGNYYIDGSGESADITLVNLQREDGNPITISRTSTYTSNMFGVASGAKLTIRGTDLADGSNGIIISGQNVSENADGGSAVNQLIVCQDSNTNGALTLENVTVENAYGTHGAAVRANAGELIVNDCLIQNIHASGYGGAFFVDGNSADVSATITNTTFKGNDTTDKGGGAIFARNESSNTCALSISGCTFQENVITTNGINGGAVYNDGASVTITETSFKGNQAANSGAIHNAAGALSATGCTFENNQGGNGGAIQTASEAALINCTFKNNTATNVGGALFVTGGDNAKITSTSSGNTFTGNSATNRGGAVMYRNATADYAMNVRSWEFNDNSAANGGAIFADSGSMTLNSAKFAGNTASTLGEVIYVDSDATIHLADCDLAGDDDTSDGEVALVMSAGESEYTVGTAYVSGKVTDVVFNYSGYSADTDLTVTNGVCVSDVAITEGSDIKINPYVHTAETPVLFGSLSELDNTELACFDATPPTGGTHLGIDAKGELESVPVARIGSIEYNSWSEAVAAIANATDSTIELLEDFVFDTQLSISRNVSVVPTKGITIYKNSAFVSNLLKTDGNSATLTLGNADFDLVIDARTVENAIKQEEYAETMSSQVMNCGNLTMTNVIVQHATINAAGVVRANGALTMSECKFISNKNTNTSNGSLMYLGKISGTKTTKTISDTTFDSNNSVKGGAILVGKDEQTVNITGCVFSSNTSTTTGGAIHFGAAATCDITDSTFTGNTSTTTGGAIHFGAAATCDITDSTFTGNTSTTTGGAIHFDAAATCDITGGTFTGNAAKTNGGVFYSNVASVCTLTNVDFDSNTSVNHGGVVRAGNSSSFKITNCDFTNNESGVGQKNGYGAAIYTAGSATVTLLVDDGNTHEFTNNTSYHTTDTSTVWGAIAHGSSSELRYSASYTFANNTNGTLDAANNGKGVGTYGSSAGNLIVTAADYTELASAIDGANATTATTILLTDNIVMKSKIDVTDKNIILTNDSTKQVTITKVSGYSDSNWLYGNGGTILKIQGVLVDNANGIIFDGQNTSNGTGGGAIIFMKSGTTSLSMENATIQNAKNGAGSAIRMYSGTMTITNCLFSGNAANNIGGAILLSADNAGDVLNATISNTNFINNSSTSSTGAIHARIKTGGSCTLECVDCTFTENTDENGTCDVYIGDGVTYTYSDSSETTE